MVNRVIVGAHYGLRGWLVQRISAVVMTLYTLLFIGILIIAPPQHYGEWRALFSGQAMKLATFLFVASLLLHSWVGMRDILMDYARPMSVRFALEVLVAVLLIAWAGWAVQILWSI
jgi:succinate dehydrogenase / fumarate reductase, membrane anchor subunit